jgi:transcriptional repressor NrdR
MVCIYCGNKTKVVNSRSSAKTFTTWRRRECLNCEATVTTREHVDPSGALNVKKHKGLEPFSRDILFLSVYNSLRHRKTAQKDADELTATVLGLLYRRNINGTLKREDIITQTASTLKRFDKAAAVTYGAYHA